MITYFFIGFLVATLFVVHLLEKNEKACIFSTIAFVLLITFIYPIFIILWFTKNGEKVENKLKKFFFVC